MNKIISSFLFFILPFSLFCNAEDSIKTGDSLPIERKMQFGAIYSPELSYRMLKANADAKLMENIRDTMEIPKFGFSAGVNFSCKLTKKCYFEAEALFSDKGERTKQYNLGNTVKDETQDQIPSKSSFNNHYYYLDIPLKINYYLVNKKIKFFISGGLSINAFLYQKTSTTIENRDGSVDKMSAISHPKFEKVNFAALIGVGMSYDLTDKYIFKLEPVYKQSITSIVNTPIKSYLYSIGLNFGIARMF
jgi:hypothetical protein